MDTSRQPGDNGERGVAGSSPSVSSRPYSGSTCRGPSVPWAERFDEQVEGPLRVQATAVSPYVSAITSCTRPRVLGRSGTSGASSLTGREPGATLGA